MLLRFHLVCMSAKGKAQNPWSKAQTADSKFLCICEAGPQSYNRSQKGCEIWFIDNWLFIDRVGEIGTQSTSLWLLLYVLSSLAEAEEKGHPLQCNVSWESFCTLKWIAKEIPQQLLKYVKIIWISVQSRDFINFGHIHRSSSKHKTIRVHQKLVRPKKRHLDDTGTHERSTPP